MSYLSYLGGDSAWSWKETQDHSKWAVSGDTPVASGLSSRPGGVNQAPEGGVALRGSGARASTGGGGEGGGLSNSTAPTWVCIGDINRMTS